MTSKPVGLPPLLPEHEAMAKFHPLITSLKKACGYDRTWAPAVHQLLSHVLSTVLRHTRPNQKLFCPCCTSQKNRELFGHYYNTDTLVCKRCSTKFRELVSRGQINPAADAFHARLVAVMDVNEVGKRKRKSRRGQAAKRTAAGAGTGAGAGDAQALPPRQAATAAQATANIRVSQADMLVEPSVIIAAAGPRQGSPGALHSGFGKEAEEDDGGSAMSSGSNTDSSDTASRVGLWGDVTSSDSSDAGDSVSVGHGQDLFHDIFDVELNYSLTDLPLFGAAPGSADAEKATTARRDRGTSSESDRSDDPSFQFGMDSMPVLNKPAAQPDVASTTMSREQFESLVAVQSCALVPSVDGGSEIPLDRASVSASAPAGEYNVRLTLSGVAATDCLVSAMVVELPTDLSHEDGSGLPPVPQRVVWDADAATPRNFKETLFPVTAEGTVTISSSCAITAKPHQKLAVVAFVTPTDAMKYNTYAEMKANAVPMLPAGGFFDVLAASSEGEVA